MRVLILFVLTVFVGLFVVSSVLTCATNTQHERRAQAEIKFNIDCDAQCQADNHSREAY